MMDAHTAQVDKLAGISWQIQGVDTRLDGKIKEESAQRENDNRAMQVAMEDITKRAAVLAECPGRERPWAAA